MDGSVYWGVRQRVQFKVAWHTQTRPDTTNERGIRYIPPLSGVLPTGMLKFMLLLPQISSSESFSFVLESKSSRSPIHILTSCVVDSHVLVSRLPASASAFVDEYTSLWQSVRNWSSCEQAAWKHFPELNLCSVGLFVDDDDSGAGNKICSKYRWCDGECKDGQGRIRSFGGDHYGTDSYLAAVSSNHYPPDKHYAYLIWPVFVNLTSVPRCGQWAQNGKCVY